MSNSAYGVIAIFLGGLALIAAAHIHLGNRQHQQRLDAAADIAARLARVQSQQAVQGDVTAKLAEMYLSVSSRLDEVMDTVVRADDQTRQILARLDAVARLDHTVRSTLRDASRAINKLTQRQQRAEARVQRIAQTVAGWEQDVGAVRDPGVVDMDTVRSMKSIEKRLSGRDPDVHPSES